MVFTAAIHFDTCEMSQLDENFYTI